VVPNVFYVPAYAAGLECRIGDEVTERLELMARAATWMHARGWKARLAKKREHRLFEQGAIELEAGSYGPVATHKRG
jgi:hypothetical protein